MCNDYNYINKLITDRKMNPYEGLCESTYIDVYHYREFAKRRDLKWLWVQSLKRQYKWDEDTALILYNKTPDGWYDAHGIYRLFDFGRGKNKTVNQHNNDKLFHEPHHDHIISRFVAAQLGWSEQQVNHPDNLQIISKIQNQVKGQLTAEQAIAVLPTIPDLCR